MVVLALETVTRRGSVALLAGERLHARAGESARTHGERLPRELLQLLADHQCALDDVDLFAIVSGPGSFTGLRVGMASIQGLALTSGKHVVAVPTLEAMAEGAQRTRNARTRNPRTPEPQNPICVPVLDGQRGDIFFAGWRLSDDDTIDAAEPVIPPSVGRPEDLLATLRGFPSDSLGLVGDGAFRYASVFEPLGAELHETTVPLAGVAATIAVRRRRLATAPHALRPVYIRRPDAVLARERARLSRP